MAILTGVLYLALCAWLALQAPRWLHASEADGGLRWLIVCNAFFIAFFGAFYPLGFIELAMRTKLATTPNALAVLALAAVLAKLMPQPQAANRVRLMMAMPKPRIVLATLLTIACAAAMQALSFPRGYESQAYHMPTAVHILQSHSLLPWDTHYPHTFPANAEIYQAFALTLLPEKLVAAVNFVFLFPLFLAVVQLGRVTGADQRAALLAACGLMGVPMIAFSASTLNADVGGLAFIAGAMYFVLCPAMPAPRRLVLAGLCAGVAFGFKSLHLISIGYLGLLVLVQGAAGAPGWRSKATGALRLGAIFTAAVLAGAGFWLVRNYLELGNPLSPVSLPIITDLLHWTKNPEVDLMHRHETQFEWVRSPLEWLVYPWVEWHMHDQNFKSSAGLGAFVACSVPLTLIALALRLYEPGPDARYPVYSLFGGALFVMLVWWILDDRQPRYALAGLVYCMPLVAWLLTQVDGSARRTLERLLTGCAAVTLFVFLSMKALLLGDLLLVTRYSTRAQSYEYPPAIDKLPAGSVILNMGDRPWHYPLAGSGFSNRVVSLPEGRELAGLEPDLFPPPSATLKGAALRAKGITHVFVSGTALKTDDCMLLREVARVDRNEFNGKPLDQPRRLFAVDYIPATQRPECK